MPVTLLAVDDSVTMRKVLEMTFAGEDMRVVLADGADSAMQMLQKENPSLALVDVTLPGKNGYTLCRMMKQAKSTMPVVLLSSKLNPYDERQGKNAGADAHIDKPYDTKKLLMLIESVLSSEEPKAFSTPQRPAKGRLNKTLIGPGAPTGAPKKLPDAGKPAAPKAPMGGHGSVRTTADFSLRGGIPKAPQKSSPQHKAVTPARSPRPAPVAAKPAAPVAAKPAAPPVAAKPAAPPVAAKPAAPPVAAKPAAPPVAAKPAAPVASAVAGSGMEQKLKELGLTAAQVEGVLALSKEVIERVVWEVVPPLAETMIKEEIQRLTAE